MTDNLANLRNYQIQLQQVETALATDPDNEDLKKLQIDLNVNICLFWFFDIFFILNRK